MKLKLACLVILTQTLLSIPAEASTWPNCDEWSAVDAKQYVIFSYGGVDDLPACCLPCANQESYQGVKTVITPICNHGAADCGGSSGTCVADYKAITAYYDTCPTVCAGTAILPQPGNGG